MRVRFKGKLGTAIVYMQADIAFSDDRVGEQVGMRVPVLLGMPVPVLSCYSPEKLAAEKLEAIVSLGEINSRMKGFHDLLVVSRELSLDGTRFVEEIRRTFKRRGTMLPEGTPIGLSEGFAQAKRDEWKAFRRRIGTPEQVPTDFGEVVNEVKGFVQKPLEAARNHDVTGNQRRRKA